MLKAFLVNKKIRIRDLALTVPGDGEAHMVTRDTGRRIRFEVSRVLAGLDEGAVMTMDFAGVGVIDYSCADEFIAKLITSLIAGEYGEKYLRLSHLNASQEENIEVALERKRLPTILVNSDSTWQCLGAIKPYLRQTLDLVMSRKTLSARELSRVLSLELNTSSTRLINLHRQRLVTRQERIITEGGREFVYAGLLMQDDGRGESRER
jgi:hypothetical protein